VPNPTTNPTRLSRTARDVAWNPLPGDALRLPGGYLTTMSSAPGARERFLKSLSQAPAGSTVVPYDGLPRVGFATGADIVRILVSRDILALRAMHVHLPEILDRWMCSGNGWTSEALSALDFPAPLPEAPFVHHAANIVHCMVKFGAPAFVAAKPARDPRNNPQPGDRRLPGYDAPPWIWPAHGDAYLDYWRQQTGGVVWECGDAPAKPASAEPGPYSWLKDFPGPAPGPYAWMKDFSQPYRDVYPEMKTFRARHLAQPIPIGSVDWAPGRKPCPATDVSEFMRKFLSDAPAPRRCPRTDPKPGDLCILTNDDVEVFKEGMAKEVWRIGGPRIRWIRGEDVVRG